MRSMAPPVSLLRSSEDGRISILRLAERGGPGDGIAEKDGAGHLE